MVRGEKMTKSKKKVTKNKILLILGLSILLFGGCGNSETKFYTYDDLPEEQKFIIDGVYAAYSDWEYVFDSGGNIPVTKVNFFYEDNQVIFTAFHPYSGTNNGGATLIYEVNTSNGQLSGHSYDYLFNEKESVARRAAMAKSAFGKDFCIDSSEEEQKDALANAYYHGIITDSE